MYCTFFFLFSVDADDFPVRVITLVPAHDLSIYLFILDPRGLAIAAARDTETPMEVIVMQVILTIDAVCWHLRTTIFSCLEQPIHDSLR